MAHYKVTVKMNVYRADVRLVKGMSVNLVMNSPGFSPLYHKNGQEIVDAFMRIYGIDLRKVNAVNSGVLEVEKLG
jgi:hypothetical protein